MMKSIQLFALLIVLSAAGCKDKQEVKPQKRALTDAVFGSGHLENKNQYAVNANTDGYLKNVYITEGDDVKNGQSLFMISNEVQETQTGNALAKLNYAKNNTSAGSAQLALQKIKIIQAAEKVTADSLNFKRYERLLKTNAVSHTDFEKIQLQYQESVSGLKVLRKGLTDLQENLSLGLENAKAEYKVQQQQNGFYKITSSTAGTVLSVAKKAGDYVKKGDVLAQIGAGQPVIKLYIAEDDIEAVKAGQKVLVSLNSRKDKILNAVIKKKYPAFDIEQQAFIVEAAFTDAVSAELINGTQLQGNILITEKKDALVIPSFYLSEGDYVSVKGSKEKRAVKVGIRTLEWTEILSGVTENDWLVLPGKH